jgi:hypothetical protein
MWLVFHYFIVFALQYFFYPNTSFMDISFFYGGGSLALVLFFSSSGGAFTNNTIAASFNALGDSGGGLVDTGHREPREKFTMKLNSLLVATIIFDVIFVVLAVI